MSRYFEGAFIRFLSWPKTALFGNYFYRRREQMQSVSYSIEKRPKSSKLGIKIIAAFLYPFFNPLAYIFRKLKNLHRPVREMLHLEDSRTYECRVATETNREFKTLLRNKIKLLNYEDKTGEEILLDYQTKEAELKRDWDSFVKNGIDTQKQMNITLFLATASDNFNIFLLALDNILKKDKCTSPFDIAGRLTGNDKFSKILLESTLLEMYRTVRNQAYENNFVDNSKKRLSASNEVPHNMIPEFFMHRECQYKWRVIYNTHMKQLYTMFGGADLKKYLRVDNGRGRKIEELTRVDTSKDETSFISATNFSK